MKPESLRIGNTLDYHGVDVHVIGIYNSIGGQMVECGYFDDSVGFSRPIDGKDCPKPIPLTEDLLVERGFDKFLDYEIYNKVWRKGWTLSVQKHTSFKGGYVLFIEDDDSESAAPPSVKIKYLHTLQNICFDLTGKELTKKEKTDV